MLGELSFLLGIIISIIFVFSKKVFWSWSLIVLGLLIIVTSFDALPTLIAGVCFILIGAYGIQSSKISLFKNTWILRSILFLIMLVLVGGSAGLINHLDAQKTNKKRDLTAEKIINKELNNLKPNTATSKYETIENQIYTINDNKIRKNLMKDYSSKKEEHTDYLETTKTKTDKSNNSSKTKVSRQKDVNYHKYLKALAKAPTTTKGSLTKAYYDDTNNYTVLILNDAALSQSSNELKAIAKAAWDAGNRLYFEYKPFPSGVVPNIIHVEDSQGNVIAKTSFTGNFKYTGE